MTCDEIEHMSFQTLLGHESTPLESNFTLLSLRHSFDVLYNGIPQVIIFVFFFLLGRLLWFWD